MAVIIEEMETEVLPGQSSAGEPGTPQPAEGTEQARMLELIELTREREERLRCD